MMTPILAIDAISKRFPGVVALDEVSFAVQRGACHALLGENGAGKSTLGKVIAGIHRPDAGRLLVGDVVAAADHTDVPRPRRFRSPLDATAAGVRIVHQEPLFCRNLSIAENLFLGRLPRRAGFVHHDALRRAAVELLARVGLDRDPAAPLAALSTGESQLVQIASAIGSGARIVIFDEPTSSLSGIEAERLFGRIAELRRNGVTILYVSHRMEEIRRLCDFVTVLRDGRHVATLATKDVSDGELVRMMVGREVAAYRPSPKATTTTTPLLDVRRLTARPRVHDVSFSISAGEIVGLAGLIGAGRSDVAAAIFGVQRSGTGQIRIRGRDVRIRSPIDAIRAGIGLLPEDRQHEGLVQSMSCMENLTLAALPRLRRCGFVDGGRERRLAKEQFERLRVRTTGLHAPISGLSGGNQQKIAIGKWLACTCDVLILDEPTRGIDIGAKAEIHAWIGRLAAEGRGILLISSELTELLNLSTRILVMRTGRIVGAFAREAATSDQIMRLMAGME